MQWFQNMDESWYGAPAESFESELERLLADSPSAYSAYKKRKEKEAEENEKMLEDIKVSDVREGSKAYFSRFFVGSKGRERAAQAVPEIMIWKLEDKDSKEARNGHADRRLKGMKRSKEFSYDEAVYLQPIYSESRSVKEIPREVPTAEEREAEMLPEPTPLVSNGSQSPSSSQGQKLESWIRETYFVQAGSQEINKGGENPAPLRVEEIMSDSVATVCICKSDGCFSSTLGKGSTANKFPT